jgi:FtsP/CotA-like multicopper oxidase with cupredoxin domain
VPRRILVNLAVASLLASGLAAPAWAQPLPGGSLDPLTVPQFVTPLVIPPVMNDDGAANSYDIAVRHFEQQILPGGIWNTLNGRNDPFPATPVWSYGPDQDPTPGVAPDPSSQFNYPAYTVETRSGTPVDVRWLNQLVANPDACDFDHPAGDPDCNYLSHLLPIDQTLHWANPPMDCLDGSTRTDCAGGNPDFYEGPVPIVTHVHGAHVNADSDGYPEAWWLPRAGNIPAGYATSGTFFDDATGNNDGALGYADYRYRQDQPASTLWYHDHTLGMTRSNVYAGPAGFWLVRGGANDVVMAYNKNPRKMKPATLPGPAPVAGDGVLALNVPGDPLRNSIREIPIAIQDRSFNSDGTLFYPDNRAFFEGLNVPGEPPQFPGAGVLDVPFVPDSDIAPIWNPEAFFNVMVVNGVSWPTLEVAPARYRFRLLNGCNSRFLNLALTYPDGRRRTRILEVPFIQIGAEQGFLPQPVEILTGFSTPITNGAKAKKRLPAPDPQQALLMGNAERADVIVDFTGLPNGTVVTMINTGPDEPFGGFPVVPADPSTTGRVMQFVVSSKLRNSADGKATDPYKLVLSAEAPLGTATVTRQVSLNELESEQVCAEDSSGDLIQVIGSTPPECSDGGDPFGPKEALLGTVDLGGAEAVGIPLKWTDDSGTSTDVQVRLTSGAVLTVPVTENPTVGDTEVWEIYNFTADAHPIHLHLVGFQVQSREAIPGYPPVAPVVLPSETGYKDTVIAYPGEITRLKAKFDLEGLYVWHCHIVEHEDNEMMRPYVVSAP